jgi:murein DD-endopeptidase MepM/ murein hydrolase activator NlpD
MKNDRESLKSVGGLSFRSLVQTLEEGDVPADILSFDENSESENPVKKFAYRVYNWMKKRAGNNLSFVSFVFDFSVYVGVRLRVIMILLAVTSEVISDATDNVKKRIIQKMFWGRGYLFKLAVQFVSIVVLVILASSYFYRSPSVSAQFEAEAAAPNSDILAIKGSTKTKIPDDRLDEGSTTYVVKVGDTISGIAKTNGLNSDTILWANDLNENSFIRPGDELKIPPGDGVLVKVKKGDSLSSLVKKYNSNDQLILDANKYLIFPPDFALEIGSELFIPDARPPEPPKTNTPIYSGVASVTFQPSQLLPGIGKFLGWPVVAGGGVISQYYSGPFPLHNGLDIRSTGGFPELVAAASGTVSFAGCHGYCLPQGQGTRFGGSNLAWTVKIDHGNGLETVYAHMNRIYVRPGQFISAGQVIGQMGRSGTVTGTHVHFMLVRAGTWTSYNPLSYMR